MEYIYVLEVELAGNIFETKFYFSTLEQAVKGFLQLDNTVEIRLSGIGKMAVNSLSTDYVEYYTAKEIIHKFIN